MKFDGEVLGDLVDLVYIGEQRSRFIYGNTYPVIRVTEHTTTLLDKDGVPMEFSDDILHHYFRQKDKWRDEQIDKILQ